MNPRKKMRAAKLLPVLLLGLGCEGIAGPDDGAWDFSKGSDEISGQPYAHASLDGGALSGMTLFVRCRLGTFDVYVATDFVTESGQVRFRIDDSGERVQTWAEASSGFDALFYRGDARAFARELARSKEMVFEAREFAGPAHTATFRLPGLDVHLPEIEAACG